MFMSQSQKPSKPEDEYFARVETEKKRKLAEEHRRELDEAQKAELKELHWMRCPKCGMELHPMVYKGVTIDKCFHCHGVFLDDGELEKIGGKSDGFIPALMSLFHT